MPTTKDIFEEIRGRVTTLEAAIKYDLKPERKGTRHWCLCPFHADKHPSLVIYPQGGYKCYACDTGGSDAISLTSRLFRLKPMDALRKLAGDFGLPVDVEPLTREEWQEMHKQRARAEMLAARLAARLEATFEKLITLYKIFDRAVKRADELGCDKQATGYQFLLFNLDFFDRESERFIYADTRGQLRIMKGLEETYAIESKEFLQWIKKLI
jgi:DNA primase